MDSKRQAFEDWAVSAIGRIGRSTAPGYTHQYDDTHTQMAWTAWQAATLAERDACAKECDAHSADYSCVGTVPCDFMEQGARSCAAAIRERSK